MNFPSVRGGQGLSKGRLGLEERGWGVAGGLEQGSWGLGRVSKGLGGWGLERAEGLGSGGGAGPSGDIRTDVRSLGRSFVRMEGKFTPLFYRTSSPSGPLPKKEKKKKRVGLGKEKKTQTEGGQKNPVPHTHITQRTSRK